MKTTTYHLARTFALRFGALLVAATWVGTAAKSHAESEGAPIRVFHEIQQFVLHDSAVVLDAPTSRAKILKRLERNEQVRVKAFVEIDGIRYFMSDWSFNRWQSRSISPNWIRIGTGRIEPESYVGRPSDRRPVRAVPVPPSPTAAGPTLTKALSAQFERHLENGQRLPETVEASIFLNERVGSLLKEEAYRVALPHAIEALRLNQITRGESHACTTLAKLHLGDIYKQLGWFEEAIPLLEDTMAWIDQNPDRVEPVSVGRIVELADLHAMTGSMSKAHSLYRNALRQAEEEHGRGHRITKQIDQKLRAMQQIRG